MNPRVGFIGLGVIGLPMAERLLEKGLPLVVWNRTAEKTEALVARGAERAESPRELARRTDIVITMVTDGPALEDLAMRADGIAAGLETGKTHCDMSTIDPGTTRRLAEHYASQGIHFVHAPVLGSRSAAAAGALLIFAGGSRPGFKACRPVFEALGKQTWHWEKAEMATCVKLACNLLLAGMIEVFAESLVFAAKAGTDPQTMMEIINASALTSQMFQHKGQTIVQRDFTANFHLRNMLKDLNLILGAGEQLGVNLPGTRAVRDVFAAANSPEFSGQDYSAVVQWLEEAAGTRITAK